MAKHRIDQAQIDRFNWLDCLEAIEKLGLYFKRDEDFHPRKSLSTCRINVSTDKTVMELLVDGPKWFDTRAHKGGFGAIALTMHLYEINFVSAFYRLKRAIA